MLEALCVAGECIIYAIGFSFSALIVTTALVKCKEMWNK